MLLFWALHIYPLTILLGWFHAVDRVCWWKIPVFHHEISSSGSIVITTWFYSYNMVHMMKSILWLSIISIIIWVQVLDESWWNPQCLTMKSWRSQAPTHRGANAFLIAIVILGRQLMSCSTWISHVSQFQSHLIDGLMVRIG